MYSADKADEIGIERYFLLSLIINKKWDNMLPLKIKLLKTYDAASITGFNHTNSDDEERLEKSNTIFTKTPWSFCVKPIITICFVLNSKIRFMSWIFVSSSENHCLR
jgi:hypothetical protein